jgi:hypothetical protein
METGALRTATAKIFGMTSAIFVMITAMFITTGETTGTTLAIRITVTAKLNSASVNKGVRRRAPFFFGSRR